MNDSGNTEELRGIPTPTTAPPHNAGRKTFIAGVILGVVTALAGLAAAVVAEDGSLFDQPAAQLFAVLTTIALFVLAGSLTYSGRTAMQHHTDLDEALQPFRTYITEQARATDRNRRLIEQHILESREWQRELFATGAALPGRMLELTERYEEVIHRLDGIEKAVQEFPDYSRGIKDGLQLRRGYIDPDSVDPE